MHATSDSALNTVSLEDLKKFAAEPENATGSVRRGVQNPAPVVTPNTGGGRGGGADTEHGRIGQ